MAYTSLNLDCVNDGTMQLCNLFDISYTRTTIIMVRCQKAFDKAIETQSSIPDFMKELFQIPESEQEEKLVIYYMGALLEKRNYVPVGLGLFMYNSK
jgi:hypothetical protein